MPSPSRRRTSATISFSGSNVAEWAWSKGRWVRQLDGAPMLAENGAPIAVDNVVIQEVVVTMSDILDAAGNPSPEVELLGEGRAWILRDGRLVIGRWQRDVARRRDGLRDRPARRSPSLPERRSSS